jgi:hypothetical protein
MIPLIKLYNTEETEEDKNEAVGIATDSTSSTGWTKKHAVPVRPSGTCSLEAR